jgi:glycine cleavage system aminomethyltransferase T
VTSLDFISPDRARTDGGFSPTLVSSMAQRQRDAGATFAERDGWLVPVSIPGEQEHLARAGIADLSHLGKAEVGGTVPDSVVGETVWHRITAGKAIVLCPYPQAAAVRARLAEAGASVLDMTGAYAILVVTGPEATAVMRRLTHLHSFPASGDVSHVTAHVLERDDEYWIVFPQEYGHYLWEVAVDAAEPFGGGPVGVDALGGSRP